MAVLQIFAGKKSGFKKNTITSFGNFQGNQSFPYVETNGFTPSDYNVSEGSIIVNNNTGVSTVVTGIESSFFVIMETQIFNSSSETYDIQVSDRFSYIKYTELDLFDDEPIEITHNIKDFKDVSKILADYTQSFKIPASKNNNRYFEHYYNQDIVDGFDARFRYDCVLKLNGADWKEGQIRLTDVGMKDGYADNYEITFFGNIVSLKSILGDDELDSLPYLDAFNHTLSLSNVARYADYGALLVFDADGNPTGTQTADYNEVPDLIYPFISHTKNRYYFDSSDSSPDIANVRNVAMLNPAVIDDYHNILYTDLKPAIRVIRIIRAIESKYGIQFSNDFIREDNKSFEMLYMMMSRESGGLDSKIEESNKELFLSDFSYSSGVEIRTGNLDTFEVYRQYPKRNGDTYRIDVYMRGDILVTGSGSYSLKIINDETSQVYLEEINLSGSFSFDARVEAIRLGTFSIKPKIILTTKAGIQNFTTDLSLKSKTYNLRAGDISYETGLYSRTATQTLSNGLDIRNSMTPKIKCIDFLKGIFKMFNIVAYVEDGVIIAKPYDDFYSSGKEVDLSYCIDSSSHKISRADIYSEINFKYKDPKDVFTIKRNELTNTGYGNLDFKSDETSSFDGGSYKVDLPFSRILSEAMMSENDNQTAICWGYAVSDSFSPVEISSLLFTSTNTGTVPSGWITDGSSTAFLSSSRHPPMGVYYDEKGRWSSIGFGEEIEPFLPATVNPYTQLVKNSLFTNFYQNQILNLYNQLSRVVSYTCYPSLKDVHRIKLNDTVIVNSKKYFINSIKNNLTTGKSEIVLISKSVELPELQNNQFYEINKDGDTELFTSYVADITFNSEPDPCNNTWYKRPFENIAISESEYVYRYTGSELIHLNFTLMRKLEGYTHDIIETNSSGLIVTKTNCP